MSERSDRTPSAASARACGQPFDQGEEYGLAPVPGACTLLRGHLGRHRELAPCPVCHTTLFDICDDCHARPEGED